VLQGRLPFETADSDTAPERGWSRSPLDCLVEWGLPDIASLRRRNTDSMTPLAGARSVKELRGYRLIWTDSERFLWKTPESGADNWG
jgi:hypothetical protein